MSTILRALRKLEEEKATEASVALHESVVAPPKAEKPRRVWMVFVAAFLAAGVGAAVAWQFAPGRNESALRLTQAAPAERAPDPIEVPERATRRLPAVAAAAPERVEPPLERAPSVASVPRTAAEARVPTPNPVAPVVAQAPERVPVREISSEVVIVEREKPPSLLAEEVPKAIGTEDAPVRVVRPAPVPLARRESKPRQLAEVKTPEPTPVPAEKIVDPVVDPTRTVVSQPREVVSPPRAVVSPPREVAPEALPAREPAPVERPTVTAPSHDIPDVRVTQTTWHPSAARRRALIEVEGNAEPMELREGDRVGQLLLTQIKPSGVVFEFHGTEVTRRVVASK